jgi:hypothetical protein
VPARLPDEDIAPVEGAAPPQGQGATVAPTELGLNAAGEALGQAATVGYRASGFIARANMEADQRTVTPDLVRLGNQIDGITQDAKATYGGEVGFGDKMDTAAQQAIADYRAKMVAKGSTSGELRQFDLGAASMRNENLKNVLQVQTGVQATGMAESFQANKAAQYNRDLYLPATGTLGALRTQAEQNYRVGDTDTLAKFQAAANAAIPAIKQQGTANWSQGDQAMMGPKFDVDAQTELTKQSLALQDYMFAHQEAGTLQMVQGSVNSGNNAVVTHPEQGLQWIEQGLPTALGPMGKGQAYTQALEENQQVAAKNMVDGMMARHDYAGAQDLLDSGKLDPYLKDGKAALQKELDDKGPGAIELATSAQAMADRMNHDIASRTTGAALLPDTPATRQQMQAAGVSPAAIAEWAAKAKLSDQVYAEQGGVPFFKMTNEDLAKAAVGPPMSQVGQPDYDARTIFAHQAQDEQRLRAADPGAYAENATGDFGARLAKEREAAMGVLGADPAHPPTPNQNIGGTYARDALAYSWNRGNRAENLAILPNGEAAAIAQSYNGATPENHLSRLQNLQAFVLSFPSSMQAPDGTLVSPRGIVVRQLQNSGLKPGAVAMAVYPGGLPGGLAASGLYTKASNNPDLDKALPQGDAQQLDGAIRGALAPWVTSNQTPGDAELNHSLQDATYRMARQVKADDPGKSWKDAAAQATQWITSAFQFGDKADQHIRISAPLAAGNYTGAQVSPQWVGGTATPQGGYRSAAGGVGRTGQGLTGAQAIRQNLDHVKQWYTGGDGVNVRAPDFGVTKGESQNIYAGQVGASGYWTNWGDHQFALVLPDPAGNPTVVQDIYKRPIILKDTEAAQMGGVSKFERPPSPTQGLATDAGHVLHGVGPPVASAALAGAIAHGPPAPQRFKGVPSAAPAMAPVAARPLPGGRR